MRPRVVPLPAGHEPGTVASQRRIPRGDSAGPANGRFTAPGGLLTIHDVAAYTKVSYWTVRSWIESGKLPVLRLPGRLIRIRPDALKHFLQTECE